MPWVMLQVESVWKAMIYLYLDRCFFLSLFKRKESLSLLGLLSNILFFNNLSTLSCRRSLVMSLKIGFYNFFMYCVNFCAFAVVPNFSYCVIYFAVKLFQYFIWHYCVTHDNNNSKIQIPKNIFNWDGKTVNWDGLREKFAKLIRLISSKWLSNLKT